MLCWSSRLGSPKSAAIAIFVVEGLESLSSRDPYLLPVQCVANPVISRRGLAFRAVLKRSNHALYGAYCVLTLYYWKLFFLAGYGYALDSMIILLKSTSLTAVIFTVFSELISVVQR